VREILFPLSAQEILKKYLRRPNDAAIFCPQESEQLRRRSRRRERKTKLYPSHARAIKKKRKTNPKRTAGEFYDEASYRRAIHRACKRAGIEKWNPNQMRHTMCTQAKKKFGWEAARQILGHNSLSETPGYVDEDREEAIAAMREFG
jgi:integrase